MQSNPILVTHSRGGITESFHRGVVCVVDENGNTIASVGDTTQICYPRSALKYFQHLPLILSGAFDHFGFTLEDLAIMCGSHNGEDMHVGAVQSILQKTGIASSELGCGPQPPTHKNDYVKLIRSGNEPSALHNNCSGKHSGFLAWCKFTGNSIEGYLKEEHPLHQEIKKYTALFHEMDEKELISGLDGCSAPIFAMPVKNQAIAYKNLIHPEKFGPEISRACKMIVEAVTTYPDMVAGTKRYCTDLMRITGGKIIGKTGADGVYSLAIPEKKWGICIKIDDGRMGPQYNVAQAVLEKLGLIDSGEKSRLQHYLRNENKNWAGNITGSTQVTAEIDKIAVV